MERLIKKIWTRIWRCQTTLWTIENNYLNNDGNIIFPGSDDIYEDENNVDDINDDDNIDQGETLNEWNKSGNEDDAEMIIRWC